MIGKGKIIIGLVFVLMFAIIIISSYDSSRRDFKRLAFIRNENNSGPIVRVYMYKTATESKQLLKEHAYSLPYSTGGKTVVFYVDSIPAKPSLFLNPPYVDSLHLEKTKFIVNRDN